MDWKITYKDRICTAKEAVSHIKSGDRVVVAHACSEPVILTDAMVEIADEMNWKDVEVVHMVAMGKAGYCAPEMSKHFRHNALFVGGSTRKAVEEGRADFTPIFFSEAPEYFRTQAPVDVALLQVSEPDAQGYCSFGVSCDYTKTCAETAKLRIAQVNPKMPRVHGDNFIPVSKLDYIVAESSDLIQLPPPKIGEVQKKIGENVASLVKDGDCLQLGIGAIPDAVLLFLKDKKDLGIHSEMFSDGVVELIEAGVITNSHKQIQKGQCVATFLMGTDRLYNYVNDNPSVNLMPVDVAKDENGKENVRLMFVQNKKGERFQPIFSDTGELVKHYRGKEVQNRLIQVPFGQLPRYMLQDVEGYVLNPEGINLILKKKQIELLNNYYNGKKETQKPEEK